MFQKNLDIRFESSDLKKENSEGQTNNAQEKHVDSEQKIGRRKRRNGRQEREKGPGKGRSDGAYKRQDKKRNLNGKMKKRKDITILTGKTVMILATVKTWQHHFAKHLVLLE